MSANINKEVFGGRPTLKIIQCFFSGVCDTALMIKPHEFLLLLRWKKTQREFCDIKIQPRHAMRKYEINPNDILEMCSLFSATTSFIVWVRKTIKTIFFSSFLCLIAARWCYCSRTFLLQTAHRTTPDKCASVGAHYVYVHVIMLCFNVSLSMYNCTRRERKNLATLQKTLNAFLSIFLGMSRSNKKP